MDKTTSGLSKMVNIISKWMRDHIKNTVDPRFMIKFYKYDADDYTLEIRCIHDNIDTRYIFHKNPTELRDIESKFREIYRDHLV